MIYVISDKMSEITIKIPENIPVTSLKKKINELVKEEEFKWMLFEKCKEQISLTESDLNDLEVIREKTWQKTKKKFNL
jgi:hypothetical protein